ncbi:BrnA antitoxin family protein [Geminicoccaceae bacterium 1502E]|nr:BrnA antitoxin family protein [Geminicoccaceae bacterium 1502E]
MREPFRPLPAFASEAEERTFPESHDSTDYVDWSKAERVRMPDLKPSTTSVSLRLPEGLLEQIKVAADRRDVPWQPLVRMWLAETVEGAALRPLTLRSVSAPARSRRAP